MDAVESVILTPTSSPVVKERFIDVLAGAAFTFHGPGKDGFQSTCKRVRPPNKPEEGIPFDMEDPMFNGAEKDNLKELVRLIGGCRPFWC